MSNAAIPLRAGSAISGIVPTTLEDVYRLAKGISASGLAPKGMDKPEQVTVAILTGLEIGLPPMFAVQKIAVINGRPSIWGDAVPALLWARGFKIREWTDGDTAYCEVTRPDGQKIERTFSDTDAKAAGLLGKSGPWSQYKARMRQMRARGYACRDGAADVLSGLYLREEVDEPMRDITPAKAEPLAIPDIPDELVKNPDTATAQQSESAAKEADTEPDDTLADPAGYLAKLEEDIALCTSVEELNEIADANADMIARLPPKDRAKAAKMLKEAAE